MTTKEPAGADLDAVSAIRTIYHAATPASIERDLRKAVALLKTIPAEEDRERAAVFMDGLSQMRSEWSESRSAARRRGGAGTKRVGRRPAPK